MLNQKLCFKTFLCLAIFISFLTFTSPALATNIEISNITDLQKIGNDAGYPLDGSYVLTQDIDASATASWNRSGTATIEETLKGGTGVNEIQTLTVTATGGYYVLSYDKDETENIAHNATAQTVETALLALDSIDEGEVTVTGDAGGPYTITFIGTLAETDVSDIEFYNIQLSGTGYYKGFDPIGEEESPFLGTFDGQGHKITSLFINRPAEQFVGLFGTVGNDGSSGEILITNLGLENVSVTGLMGVGGLVGLAYGENVELSNNYVTGAIIGKHLSDGATGGLIGGSVRSSITNCYSLATVGEGAITGGLVGMNVGPITKSYSAGAVSGTETLGGLVAYNDDGSESEDEGPFGSIATSYWDVTATGQALSSGSDEAIYGKTTANMKKEATFVGWDFTNTWTIVEDTGYPTLKVFASTPTTYTLTYTAGAGGSITGTSPQTVNSGADGSAVTVVANSGYRFVNWSDNSTANPRTDTTIGGNVSVTANFEAIPTSGHTSGSSVASQVSNLLAMGNKQMAEDLMKQYPNLVPDKNGTSSKAGLSSAKLIVLQKALAKSPNLGSGSIGNDVKLLQQFLNAKGFLVAKTGLGSPGKETLMFGAGTRTALAKFQKANGIKPASGFFGPVTRALIGRT